MDEKPGDNVADRWPPRSMARRRVSDLDLSRLQETGCLDARGYTIDALLDALIVLGMSRADASIDFNGDLVWRAPR